MPVDTLNQQSAYSDVEFGDASASTFGDALSGFADLISSATPLIMAETGNGNNSQLRFDPVSRQWVYGTPQGYYGTNGLPLQQQSSIGSLAGNSNLIFLLLFGGAIYLAVKHL
jgi:hypothetical protein